MTISIWRYSHLALAVSSFIFILLASLTGLVLAFEPVSDSLQPYAIHNLDNVTLAQTIGAARENFDEVIEIKIEKGKFVQADVITKDGDSRQVYINPETAITLGEVTRPNEFFQFVTTLHRSLFLHGLGRIFMGLTALFLFLIAITGTILVVKRQRRLSRFFSNVIRENTLQFYHIVFGRIWLLPILIISLTGIFLTLNEFDVFEKPDVSHNIDYDKIQAKPQKSATDFPAFQIPLSNVVSVEFPFSDDAEDNFPVKLSDKEIIVSQFTGEILSEQEAPSIENYINLGLDLHTGRASILWALVLAIACVNILYFIYSGFAMTLKRRNSKVRNRFTKDEAEIIILAGSENGSTMAFAKTFHASLLKSGQKSFFGELNDYQKFGSAGHIVVITATYGNGEAPANAKKALQNIIHNLQDRPVNFSVVGFGSHAYPDFCRFAFDVYNLMSLQPNLVPLIEIRTINDKSIESFTEWAGEWANRANIQVEMDLESIIAQPNKLQKFTVVEKTESEIDNAFIVRLEPKKQRRFQSGDLLNVYPADDHRERQYSIGKVGKTIQLSVKRHAYGIGSQFLYALRTGQVIKGRIVENPEFHFDKGAKQTILISNGTGIAPFLGMIDENILESECHLFCGFKDSASFEPYRNFIDTKIRSKKLAGLNLAFSREGEKIYVVDLLARDPEFIASVLKNNGQIMICGSLAMQNNVLSLLAKICDDIVKKPLSYFQSSGQIKMDCY